MAGLSMFAAASAGAQVSAQLTAPYAPGGGAVTAFGYYMSPYTGTVDGKTYQFNCVDFFHDVVVGQTWNAISTNLGAAMADNSLLSSTRDGSNGYYTTGDALAAYEKVAWLSTQYPTNPATNAAQSIAIQTAIWAIASNQLTPTPLSYMTNASGDVAESFDVTNPSVISTGYWINQANVQYSQQADGFYNNFYVLTDVNKASAGSAQEFVYYSATPEPGTLILLGTGMLLVLGVGMWRRRGKGFDGVAVPAVGALS